MDRDFIGFTIEVAGNILVAIAVLHVHHRMWRTHRLGQPVLAAMHREYILGLTGILLIIVGYLLQVPAKW